MTDNSGVRRKIGRWAAAVPAILAVGAMACASGARAPAPSGPYGAPTAEAAVRRFLDAANAEDYQTMMQLFGTREGPAVKRFGVTDVEQRMIFLSRLLRHEEYGLRQENLAQLGPERVRYVATMRGTRKGDVEVPIVAVPDHGGRWYVEKLEVDRLAGSPLE